MTPQELKASILHLAIQGKLVEQRPEEGTGGELLEKILATKNAKDAKGAKKSSRAEARIPQTKAVREADALAGVRRGVKAASAAISSPDCPVRPSCPVPLADAPFEIPESWVWVRLGELLKVIGGVSYEKKDVCNSGLRILRGGNIQNMEILLDDADVFLPEQYRDDEKIIRVGDILIVASTGSKTVIGKAGYIDKPIPQTMIGAFLRICRPSSLEFVGYLRIIFESDFYRKHIRELSQGTNINNIKEAYVTQFAIPLPPLAEQKRIVAKIEELLPYIDRYEKAWSKLEDFNKRFPGDMQKSLLQMAIQGKLVDQRPEEGTGEELYRQIQSEKQRLIKSGKIKKEKHLPEITPDEIPFDIPESWKWVRLGRMLETVTSGSRDWAQFYSATGDKFIRMGNLSRNSFDMRLDNVQHVKLPEKIEGQRTSLQAGDLLFSITGEVGTLGLIPECFGKAYINQHTAMLRFLGTVRNKYVPYLMLTDYAHKYYEGNQHGIKNSFRLENISSMPIPLPPLAEQKRIVAKLEELLPLCERLK